MPEHHERANLSRLNPPPAAQLLVTHLLLLSLAAGLSQEGSPDAGSGAGGCSAVGSVALLPTGIYMPPGRELDGSSRSG